jgi:hypothetical protein
MAGARTGQGWTTVDWAGPWSIGLWVGDAEVLEPVEAEERRLVIADDAEVPWRQLELRLQAIEPEMNEQ